MSQIKKSASDPSKRSSPSAGGPAAVSERLEQFERRQSELWRLTFFLLLVLSIVFAVVSWDTIRTLAHRFEALPIGLVLLVVLFGLYAWKRTQEISELRGLVRGIEQRDAVVPNEKQLDQLFEVISRSQQGYRDLIDSFDDILLAISLDGQIRAANRSFADLVGASFPQIIGRPLSEFVEEGTGDGGELAKNAMPRFLERRVWTGIVQVRLKGRNSINYFDCVAHAMLRGNDVHGITVLARDITALRKNEARFTELFESLQEGIYIATPDDRLLDVNPALARMLGYDSKEELLSRTFADLLPDEGQRRALRQEVDSQPTVQGREITLTRKDGRPLVCLNTAGAVRDTSGRVVRYHGALMDITERREMERRLYQQQEFARRLIDSFPDLIFVVDTAGHYTFVSPRVRDILGYEPEETQDWELGGRTHLEDRPALLALFAELVGGRQTFASLEVRVRNKQGEWRRLRCHFSPLFNETGKIDGVVISGRDVTELKRLEEQLIQAEKLAAMGQMLAGVAHELNNPLTAILGVTELLRDSEGVQENTKRQLELTHRQARRAARIVQNLLEFSRPAAPQKRALGVNSLIERTLQLQDHSLRRNNVSVDFQPQSDLPAVIGDANQLIQVFLNLISNAEHAIREVRETGRIQIRIGRIGGHISVTVQDDGVGVAQEALPRLFDPFYTTKRPGGGTGLGLSICMSIVREHGGSIDVETLPAGGSAFTVYLPVAPRELFGTPLDGGALSAEPAAPAGDILRGRSILILDDEESIRMLLEEGLSAHGMRVDCAANSREALELVSNSAYDLILCDVNLSGGGAGPSGREAALQIVASSRSTAKPEVIFMTGDLVEDNGSGGHIRQLQKPFRISDVLTVLRETLSPRPVEKLQK
ncbi:MAG TPA: PAS domain S-box protein [Candidatus Acidoferrum sp.]|nr:PAS domain S-box protein [Candidatus Acidoferrum sp.]